MHVACVSCNETEPQCNRREKVQTLQSLGEFCAEETIIQRRHGKPVTDAVKGLEARAAIGWWKTRPLDQTYWPPKQSFPSSQ
mmetsp:Transcript_39147/g.81263  ORF Transcript_39147/g.81263 Transcript_39147/m.81263 type:complete len:82 (-) Transcript_39147:600-845(-)